MGIRIYTRPFEASKYGCNDESFFCRCVYHVHTYIHVRIHTRIAYAHSYVYIYVRIRVHLKQANVSVMMSSFLFCLYTNEGRRKDVTLRAGTEF